MSVTTPVYQLPYPVPSDPADVPADVQALATKLDSVLGVIQAGPRLAYVSATAAVGLTATAEASAVVVITAPSVTVPSGATILLEFYAAQVAPPSPAGSYSILQFWDGATSLGHAALVQNPGGGSGMGLPVLLRRFVTPSAGAHTFSVRGFVSTGSGSVNMGPGTSGQYGPGYLLVEQR